MVNDGRTLVDPAAMNTPPPVPAVDEGTLRDSLPALLYDAVKQAFASIVETIKEACACARNARIGEAVA